MKSNLEMLKEIKSLNLGDAVVLVRQLPKKDREGTAGEFLTQQGVIRISPEENYTEQVNTLVHESLHYFSKSLIENIWLFASYSENKHIPNMKYLLEEFIVEEFEHRIMTLLRLNPLLMKWIKKTNG